MWHYAFCSSIGCIYTLDVLTAAGYSRYYINDYVDRASPHIVYSCFECITANALSDPRPDLPIARRVWTAYQSSRLHITLLRSAWAMQHRWKYTHIYSLIATDNLCNTVCKYVKETRWISLTRWPLHSAYRTVRLRNVKAFARVQHYMPASSSSVIKKMHRLSSSVAFIKAQMFSRVTDVYSKLFRVNGAQKVTH